MRTLILLGIILFTSCNKQITSKVEELKTSNELNFIAETIDYISPNAQLKFEVNAVQDESYKIEFRNTAFENIYLWYLPHSPESYIDSVYLIGRIEFNVLGSPALATEVLDIEFVFHEALDKLIINDDSTYTYINFNDFYERLLSDEWNQSGWSQNKSQIQLSSPTPIQLPNWEIEYSSNGIYFEDENVNIIRNSFDQELGQISVSGIFNFYIKELSCGFYQYQKLTEGKFSADFNQ